MNKALRVLLVTNSMILVSGAMLGPIYALFVEEVGGDLLDASIAGALFALAAGITAYLSGRYSDRLKENELIMVFGYFVMGAGFLLYMGVNSIWALFAVQILIGFGEAIYAPSFDAVYTKHMSPTRFGRQWGAWELMSYFTAAGGALFGGFIAYNFGFKPLFLIMGTLSLASAVYIYFLPRRLL